MRQQPTEIELVDRARWKSLSRVRYHDQDEEFLSKGYGGYRVKTGGVRPPLRVYERREKTKQEHSCGGEIGQRIRGAFQAQGYCCYIRASLFASF